MVEPWPTSDVPAPANLPRRIKKEALRELDAAPSKLNGEQAVENLLRPEPVKQSPRTKKEPLRAAPAVPPTASDEGLGGRILLPPLKGTLQDASEPRSGRLAAALRELLMVLGGTRCQG